MNNVITHPRFARAKVEQPHPRLRKGTINFRQRRMDILYARDRAQGRTVRVVTAQDRENSQRVLLRQEPTGGGEDVRDAQMLPLFIENSGRGAFVLYRALYELGIKLEFSSTQRAIVMRAADGPRGAA